MFPTDDEVGDLLHHIDDDGSGLVDYSELMKHMAAQVRAKRHFTYHLLTTIFQIDIRKSSDPEHDFKEAFLIFDKDGKYVVVCAFLVRCFNSNFKRSNQS